MSTQTFGSTPDNVVVDGANQVVKDYGGTDIYTISPNLSGNVTLTDTQASNIVFPDGLVVTAARFLSDRVQFEVDGHTITLEGRADLFTFKFGGSPFDPDAGTALDYTQTAAAFGTTVPAPNAPFNPATNVGEINSDGTVGASGNIIALAGETAVTAAAGVAEVFVLNFNSASGTSISDEAVVTITGFDSAQDILRFNDANSLPISAADFLDTELGGALIAITGGFEGDPVATTISFNDDLANPAPGAVITLLGIQDATLGGTDPFYEIV